MSRRRCGRPRLSGGRKKIGDVALADERVDDHFGRCDIAERPGRFALFSVRAGADLIDNPGETDNHVGGAIGTGNIRRRDGAYEDPRLSGPSETLSRRASG
jgi:hypothetical protein